MSFDEGIEFYELFFWTCDHNNQVKNTSMIPEVPQCSIAVILLDSHPVHCLWRPLISFLIALPYSQMSYPEILKYVVYEFGFFHLA